MLLGKRPRPPMKKTTSLSEITFDIGETTISQHSDHNQNNPFNGTTRQKQLAFGGGGEGLDQRFMSMVFPRNNHRRHSGNFADTAHFLRACCLCKRRLVPGRDIYMYRGDSAFCSLECRQHQMNQDEKKREVLVGFNKETSSSSSSSIFSYRVPSLGQD